MKIAHTIPGLRRTILAWKREGKSIGFVPTMGNLHAGHLRLLQQARNGNERVVLSIYVNPLQFGPREDFASYPRTLREDLRGARGTGTDMIFLPGDAVLYPPGFSTRVEESRVTRACCGRFRPGHFSGVATVVAKLFNLVQPDRAYFGRKDAQQLRLVERMVEDLDFPVRIVPVDTVREKDGLAISSRNRRLTPEHRAQAPVLYRALRAMAERCGRGKRDAGRLLAAGRAILRTVPEVRLQYLAVVRRRDFTPVPQVTEPCVALLAAFAGQVRLIDNIDLFP